MVRAEAGLPAPACPSESAAAGCRSIARIVRVTRASAFGGRRSDRTSACCRLHRAHSQGRPRAPPMDIADAHGARARARDQRRQRTQRRQPGTLKAGITSARSGIGRQPLEIIGRVPERHAAIALAVLVPALVALPLVAEHQRARRHQRVAARGTVLEAAGHDDRNRVVACRSSKARSCGPRRAHHVGHGPAVAAAMMRGVVRPGVPCSLRRASARSSSTAIFAKIGSPAASYNSLTWRAL